MRLKKFISEQQIGGGAVGIIPDTVTILDFPELRQSYDYDCGALSLQSVLVYYGLDMREEMVMKQLGSSEAHGTPITMMIAGATYYGIDVDTRNDLTIDDLKNSIDNGWPVIIALQAWADYDRRHEPNFSYNDIWNEGHYVVAIGYDDQKIYFEDPSDPRRTWLSYPLLNDRWHDQDDTGEKYIHWGMICRGSPIFRSNQMVYMEGKNLL